MANGLAQQWMEMAGQGYLPPHSQADHNQIVDLNNAQRAGFVRDTLNQAAMGVYNRGYMGFEAPDQTRSAKEKEAKRQQEARNSASMMAMMRQGQAWAEEKRDFGGREMTNLQIVDARQEMLDNWGHYSQRLVETGAIQPGQEESTRADLQSLQDMSRARIEGRLDQSGLQQMAEFEKKIQSIEAVTLEAADARSQRLSIQPAPAAGPTVVRNQAAATEQSMSFSDIDEWDDHETAPQTASSTDTHFNVPGISGRFTSAASGNTEISSQPVETCKVPTPPALRHQATIGSP